VEIKGNKMSTAKPTLKANWSEGSGEIGNLEEWRKHDMMLRADLLQDWLHGLEKEYQLTLEECFPNKLRSVK
jgi:hypothetical protein